MNISGSIPVWLGLNLQGESKLDRAIWIGFLVYAATLIFSTALVQTTVVVLTVLIGTKLWTSRPRIWRRTHLDLPILAFVAARGLAILFSVDPILSLPALHTELFFTVMFFIVTQAFDIQNKDRVTAFLRVMIISGVVAGVYGSAKYVLGINHRASSTTSGYYTLGMYLSTVLALLMMFGRTRNVAGPRWLWMIWVGLVSFGILLTFNRIHWGIMVLVVGFVGIFRERRVLAGLAVAGVLASLLIPGVTERLSQLGNFGSHLTGRDVIWRGAMDLMTERPVTGFGLKTFPVIFPYFNLLEDKGVGTWHNDIIQVYLESGLIGLATFGWLIVAAYRFGIQAIRRHRADEFSKTLSQSLLIIISTFLLGGLVGGFITDPLSSLVFRQCLGFLALLSIVPATRPEAGVP